MALWWLQPPVRTGCDREDGGDIGDEGRGGRRDGSRLLQPMKLHTFVVDMQDEALD